MTTSAPGPVSTEEATRLLRTLIGAGYTQDQALQMLRSSANAQGKALPDLQTIVASIAAAVAQPPSPAPASPPQTSATPAPSTSAAPALPAASSKPAAVPDVTFQDVLTLLAARFGPWAKVSDEEIALAIDVARRTIRMLSGSAPAPSTATPEAPRPPLPMPHMLSTSLVAPPLIPGPPPPSTGPYPHPSLADHHNDHASGGTPVANVTTSATGPSAPTNPVLSAQGSAAAARE